MTKVSQLTINMPKIVVEFGEFGEFEKFGTASLPDVEHHKNVVCHHLQIG